MKRDIDMLYMSNTIKHMAKIGSYKQVVGEILLEHQKARDSYPATYHYMMSKLGYDSDSITAYELFKLIDEGHLPNFEVIHRTRRLVQEQNPALRGENYEYHKRLEDEVKQEIMKEKDEQN